jgi:CDP-diacylglycerol--serine O-phosphatidyltransferase
VRKGIYIIPNSLTLCGMFAGFYSMVAVLNGNYVHAGWAIIIAGFFDGIDGWVARLTGTSTKFGIELDSLSDVIAFGVAPAVMVYHWTLSSFGRFGAAAAFLFVACGALRLARYNVQMGAEEKKHFTGMPIPAAAFILATTVLFYTDEGFAHDKSYYVLFLTIACAGLMVSTMKFRSQKEINVGKKKPFMILVGVALYLAVFITHPQVTVFVTGILYLLSGPAEFLYDFLIKQNPPPPAKA